MVKTIQPNLLSFDIEWIPDPLAAEAVCGVEHSPPHSHPEAFQALWQHGRATEEQPRPFIKLILSRIVSIAGIFREASGTESNPGGTDVVLKLVSLPSDTSNPEKSSERYILERFFKAVSSKQPQLVGYNSANSDIPILAQRGIANGLQGHAFSRRPSKPWEGVDYFSTHSDFHVDLAQALGTNRMTPRLDELARVCGIPGKVDTAGDQVWKLYLSGKLDEIVAYNEFDAFTTHLLWAQVAHFSGLLTTEQWEREKRLVRELALSEIQNGHTHLERYLNEWDRLRSIHQKW